MTLHHIPSPHADLAAASDEHDEHVADHQQDVCDELRKGLPCGRCAPCVLVWRAIRYGNVASTDALEADPPEATMLRVIAALVTQVDRERAARKRHESEAAFERRRAERWQAEAEDNDRALGGAA